VRGASLDNFNVFATLEYTFEGKQYFRRRDIRGLHLEISSNFNFLLRVILILLF
jgi:hypothetical protein